MKQFQSIIFFFQYYLMFSLKNWYESILSRICVAKYIEAIR